MTATHWLLVLVLLAGFGFLHLVGRRLAAAEVDWGRPWLNRLDGLNRLFCRRYHRLEHDPVELPERGPALVVANHVSGLDPLLMIAACRRPLRFIIADEEYKRFGLRWLFRAAGCIPVDRRSRPERALRVALKALRRGEVVALFPHGRIHLDSEPARPLKPGVARLSDWTGAPVYPLRIDGVRGEGLTVTAVLLRSRARVRAFAPLTCHGRDHDSCLAELAGYLDGTTAPSAAPACGKGDA